MHGRLDFRRFFGFGLTCSFLGVESGFILLIKTAAGIWASKEGILEYDLTENT